MAELKTKPTTAYVADYLDQFDKDRRKDAETLIQIMEEASKEKPVMWGSSIIGFGNKKYKYKSGREIDYFLIGFSVRKKALTLYLSIETNLTEFIELGKHEKGVGCLYIQKLEDVNLVVLANIIKKSIEQARKSSE
ncbi:MAG: DUF1801 domain-containing protein [Acholeplasmataceae bacterium]|nr:DUF1801 domain-containing protein [Acholeplasmataceae bacterium]